MKVVALGLRGFPDIQGGVETHCEQLYTRIAAKGHEVIVIGRAPYMPRPVIKSYKGVRLIWLNCPRWSILEAFFHTLAGVFVAFYLRPQILHVHAIGPSLLIPLARLLGLHVVATNHGPDYDRQKWGYLSKRILKLGERFGSRWASRVIAISQPVADHLLAAFGCESTMIPNGVVVRPPSAERDVLDGYHIVPRKYFLAVGRLVPEKGFHDLVDAFIQANLPDWKLVIVGRADHENAYSIGLKEKVSRVPSIVMTGFLSGEPLHQLYSHAGALVLPSYHEGLPIVMLEGMSYGLPTSASDIPANRQAGLPDDCFFPVGDVDRIAAKLADLATRALSGADKAQRVQFVTQLFDWDAITRSTLEVYDAVVESRAPRHERRVR